MFWRDDYAAKEIIVGLDFDGVLAIGVNAKIKYAKQWFGIDLTIEQTKKESFDSLMKSLGRNINYRTLMDPLNEKHIIEYDIPENCREVLGMLYSEGFRFVVITSRNEHDFPYAQMFLEKNFSGIIKYVHNTKDEPKDRFVSRLKVRIYVDDDLKKLIELENTPAQLFYYRQPENSHINLPLFGKSRFHEIRDWKGFYDAAHYVRDMHEAVCLAKGIENNSFHLKEIDEECRKLDKNEVTSLIQKCKEARN